MTFWSVVLAAAIGCIIGSLTLAILAAAMKGANRPLDTRDE